MNIHSETSNANRESDEVAWNPPDLMASLMPLVGILCVFVMMAMLVFGCYYAIQTFIKIGAFVHDPSTVKLAVVSMQELVGAEDLNLPLGSDKMKFGKYAATSLLMFAYMLWAWIPLKIVSVCGSVLLKHGLPQTKVDQK